MCRVASETRILPILDYNALPSKHLDPLIDVLEEAGNQMPIQKVFVVSRFSFKYFNTCCLVLSIFVFKDFSQFILLTQTVIFFQSNCLEVKWYA